MTFNDENWWNIKLAECNWRQFSVKIEWHLCLWLWSTDWYTNDWSSLRVNYKTSLFLNSVEIETKFHMHEFNTSGTLSRELCNSANSRYASFDSQLIWQSRFGRGSQITWCDAGSQITVKEVGIGEINHQRSPNLYG